MANIESRKRILEEIRLAREGKLSRTELHVDTAVRDVYEKVSEEDYISKVRSRRDADDFVVEDNGLGYTDDGEEIFNTLDGCSGRDDGEGEGSAAERSKGAQKKHKRDYAAAVSNSILSFVKPGVVNTNIAPLQTSHPNEDIDIDVLMADECNSSKRHIKKVTTGRIPFSKKETVDYTLREWKPVSLEQSGASVAVSDFYCS